MTINKSLRLKRFQGFTIIELMITIFVLAILVALAAPSMRTLLINNQSETLAERLTTALQIARTEAIKRGGRVSVCAANADLSGCGDDWTNGWLVVTDNAVSDGAAAVVAGEIIAQSDEPHDDSVITAENNGAVKFVRYTSTGELARIGGNGNTNPVTFTVRVDGCKGNKQRQISIGVAGMMEVDKAECPEG